MSKTRTIIALVAAGSFLAFSAVGPADAAKKKPSCKKKKEQKGCKLPNGANYQAILPAGGSVNLAVEKSSWGVVVVGLDRGQGPCNPRFSRSGKLFKGRPKVGKTYSIDETSRRPDSGVDNQLRITGTVKVTSAKKARFKGTFTSQRSFRDNVFTPCQRTFDLNAARNE